MRWVFLAALAGALACSANHGLFGGGGGGGAGGDGGAGGGAACPFCGSDGSTHASDGGFVSIGCGEPEFYRGFIDALGLDPADLPSQDDRSSWPQMRERLAAMFRGRTRDEWCSTLTRPDVCFAPVLTLAEAPAHPHHVGRGTFIDVDGVTQPAPAPRFSRTEPSVPRPPRLPGEDTDEVLTTIGIDIADIEDMRRRGVVS